MKEELRRLVKAIENLQYIIMVALLVAQVVVGKNFLIGQVIYLVADIISCWRTFALGRPTSDKVKDILFIAVCIALIISNFIK